MPDLNTRQCDVCDEIQRRVNHWFVIVTGEGPFLTILMADSEKGAQVRLPRYYCCSRNCLLKAISEWSATLSSGDRRQSHDD